MQPSIVGSVKQMRRTKNLIETVSESKIDYLSGTALSFLTIKVRNYMMPLQTPRKVRQHAGMATRQTHGLSLRIKNQMKILSASLDHQLTMPSGILSLDDKTGNSLPSCSKKVQLYY
jgi:hypothetical protein